MCMVVCVWLHDVSVAWLCRVLVFWFVVLCYCCVVCIMLVCDDNVGVCIDCVVYVLWCVIVDAYVYVFDVWS